MAIVSTLIAITVASTPPALPTSIPIINIYASASALTSAPNPPVISTPIIGPEAVLGLVMILEAIIVGQPSCPIVMSTLA